MNGPPQKPTTACSGASSRRTIADRLEDRRERLLRVGDAQLLDGGERADRLAHDRADALDELDVEAHRDDRGHDVREHHGRVDVVPAHRLQRHLGASAPADRLISKNAWLLADRAVLGQRAPGLPHEPHRRPLDGSRRAARTSSGSTRPRLAAHGKGRLPSAGANGRSRPAPAPWARALELENAGTVPWRRDLVSLPLARRPRQPDRLGRERTPVPQLAPGERATVDGRVRAPIPPGRYRFALDLVAEHRAWFSELGSDARQDVDVAARAAEPRAAARGLGRAPDWDERVAAAHAEGYGVVAGAIEWRPACSTPAAGARAVRAGAGPDPGFRSPLLCPSVLAGVELERLDDVAGLPAFAAPRDEPWLYDGRIVLRREVRAAARPARV